MTKSLDLSGTIVTKNNNLMGSNRISAIIAELDNHKHKCPKCKGPVNIAPAATITESPDTGPYYKYCEYCDSYFFHSEKLDE